MAKTTAKKKEECLICGKELEEESWWPACPGDCLKTLTEKKNHKGENCWITMEELCDCSPCTDCPIFRVTKRAKEKGADKMIPLGY